MAGKSIDMFKHPGQPHRIHLLHSVHIIIDDQHARFHREGTALIIVQRGHIRAHFRFSREVPDPAPDGSCLHPAPYGEFPVLSFPCKILRKDIIFYLAACGNGLPFPFFSHDFL